VRRARQLPVLLAVLVALALSACSTVPSSSATVQITQAPSRPTDAIGIEPLPPEPGATPEEVVRSFVDADASTVRGHPVARQHLAQTAARSWSDEDGITVISPSYSTITTDVGTVQMSSKLVGTVDAHGVFAVGGGQVYTRTFTLQQVDGQWRITNPPAGLLLLEPDFERLYDERNAYFVDPTGQRLVPDPRYLITGQAQPTALVERLLDGPAGNLADGVRNPLAGAQLRRAVTVTPSAVTVDLTGIGTQPATVLSEICAQLVWTLDQLSLHDVEVLVDGEPVDLDGVPTVQSTDDWESFDPDTVPASAAGHYLDAGALRTTDGKPVPGPAGAGTYALAAAAVLLDHRTGDPATVAGTTAAGGSAALLIGPYGGALAPVLTGGTLSPPSVTATRSEVWVVRDGTEVLRVPVGGASQTGPPQTVATPTLPGLGRATRLVLSPDGVRAAVVVDGPAGLTLYVGTVVRSPDGGVSLVQLTAVTPTLSQISDVAWRTSGGLLVLSGDPAAGRMAPYTVRVDGFGVDEVPTAGLPAPPTAIAALPGRQALVSAGNSIWEQVGGTWVTLLPGQAPLPGGAPFYPL
jgi:lipoprotein LpqB-like beta-propeller protein/sporulation and spore germination protein